MKSLKLLNNGGDTIVEVLIVLAVLGLAFAVSSATAVRGLNQSRNAEEHSQALGYLNSQIEQIRTTIAKQQDGNPGELVNLNEPFCMTGTNTFYKFSQDTTSNLSTVPDAINTDSMVYPSSCKRDGLFNGSIVFVKDPTDPTNVSKGYFQIKVRWEGIGSLGRQQENMTYRIQALSATPDTGIILAAQATKVIVNVTKLDPNSANTSYGSPSCNPAGAGGGNTQAGFDNVPVSLVNNNAPSASPPSQNTSSGTAVFAVGDNGNYTATVAIPPNYKYCDGNTTSNVALVSKNFPNHIGTQPTMDVKLTPVCHIENQQGAFHHHMAHHHFEETRYHTSTESVHHYSSHQESMYIQSTDAVWPWTIGNTEVAGASHGNLNYAFTYDGKYWSWHHNTDSTHALYTSWSYSEWTVVDEDWYETVTHSTPYLYTEDWDYNDYDYYDYYDVKVCP